LEFIYFILSNMSCWL